MAIPGYTHRPDLDVWVAEGFQGLDWADGSESYLRQVLEQADTVSDYPVELREFIRDWPSRYHLSHQRVNLLEAVRDLLDPSWRAIEFGAGTGIITKWLAQAVSAVDAFEGSLQRAHVNRIRTRDDQNVRVLVGDMVASPYPSEYELATLVGVLEYTPPQDGGSRREACLALLKKIRGSLVDNGVLLLAIENRLGNKYWAGCTEDHSSILYEGILGYPDDGPITFSRDELQALLREAGFGHQQFYHLHPDYKLPTVVMRESPEAATQGLHQWIRGLAEDYSRPRDYLVPDQLLAKSVEDAGLFWHFSNSFLVLCSPSRDATLSTDWIATRYSNSGRKELHHTTRLIQRDGALRVERSPIRSGCSSVDLGEYAFALSDSDYVTGSLLVVEAIKALVSRDWFEKLASLSRELLEGARTRFKTVEADPRASVALLEGSALDFTLWNIMRRSDGSFCFFDTKWAQKAPLATDYLLFRSLYYLLREAGPFVQQPFHKALMRLMRRSFPDYDRTRLRDHLQAEQRLQECFSAVDQSISFWNWRGRPLSASTGSHLFEKLRRRAPTLASMLKRLVRLMLRLLRRGR